MRKQDWASPRQGPSDHSHCKIVISSCLLWIWMEATPTSRTQCCSMYKAESELIICIQDGASGKRLAPTKHGRQWTEQCCCEQTAAVCRWHRHSSWSFTVWSSTEP